MFFRWSNNDNQKNSTKNSGERLVTQCHSYNITYFDHMDGKKGRKKTRAKHTQTHTKFSVILALYSALGFMCIISYIMCANVLYKQPECATATQLLLLLK